MSFTMRFARLFRLLCDVKAIKQSISYFNCSYLFLKDEEILEPHLVVFGMERITEPIAMLLRGLVNDESVQHSLPLVLNFLLATGNCNPTIGKL